MELKESVASESSLPESRAAGNSPLEAASGDVNAAADVLERFVASFGKIRPGEIRAPGLSLKAVPAAALRVLDEALGQGEVSAVVASAFSAFRWRVQETAFAGVWRLQGHEDHGAATEEVLEAGDVPEVVTRAASRTCSSGCAPPEATAAAAKLESAMDYRCPVCAVDLKKRRLSEAVITKMEIDCSHCGKTIRLNLHRVEMFVVLLNFGAIVTLAVLAYWLGSERLVLMAFGAAMLGALAFPLLERTLLRTWPRYSVIDRPPGP